MTLHTSRNIIKWIFPLLLSCTQSSWAVETAPVEQKSNPVQAVAGDMSNIGEDPGPIYTLTIRKWAEVTHFAKNAADVAVGKLKGDMQSDPKLKSLMTPAFLSDLEQYFYELFISQETIDALARLYAQYFTLDEMQELIHFYQTPLGQKLVKLNPELMLRSQQIGVNLLKKHERKYMEIVAKHIKPAQEENAKEKSATEKKVQE